MSEDRKFKLLIVDDEEDNLMLLYRTLRQKYDVRKTTSPLQALEMMKEDVADLVLSDHKMPEMSGVELLQVIQEKYPDTLGILVTAYSDFSILMAAINTAKIHHYVKKPFNPEELTMIVESSLDYLTLKKENEILISDLKDLFSGTIKAITDALDAKDTYTAGRSKRVTLYSLALAEYLGLDETELSKIEIAGLLHDIGMIGVSDDVLNKIEELTPNDIDEIQQHVTHGVKILGDIKQLKDVVEIIKYHHEHYNGDGYVENIENVEIPIGSRIICIADAFDGMVSERAYRKSKTYDEAMSELERLSGTQFDPDLVQKFKLVFPQVLEKIKEYEDKIK